MAIPSNFGPLPQAEFSAPFIHGDPEFGDVKVLDNSTLCENRIVVLKRGKVSFVSKAITAQLSGASALIVCQNSDTWPFAMTDSSNEIVTSSIELNIPIVMISQRDAVLIEKILQSNDVHKDTVTNNKSEVNETDNDNENDNEKLGKNDKKLECKLICGRFEEECSICQDPMIEGHIILKLACRHAYHSECVQTWLEKHNTCPMCRNEMPRHEGPRKKQPTTENEINHSMPYFN